MKEFLEKSLRQQVTIMEDKELYKKFPLVYRGRYDIFQSRDEWCSMDGLFIRKTMLALSCLRRDRAKVGKNNRIKLCHIS